MPKKHSLILSQDHEFKIIGVVSPLVAYRLCYFLNKALLLRLARIMDLPARESIDDGYQLFKYTDHKRQNNWYLISNKLESQLLVPDLKHIDYFLLADGLPHSLTLEKVAATIRKISLVQTAQTIHPNQVKGVTNLFDDLEMHLIFIEKGKKHLRLLKFPSLSEKNQT